MSTKDIAQSGMGPSVDRRPFLRGASASVGGLVLGFNLPMATRADAAVAGEAELHAYVRIGGDGSVTIAYGGSELGQGTMSGLAQILAEELKVDWEDVTVEQAEYTGSGIRYLTRPVTYLTAGSGAVRRQHDQLRNAGAAAREMLVAAGAARMDVDASDCRAEGGVVYGPSESFGYGELAEDAATMTVPASPAWTDPSDYTIIGRSKPRKDIPLKVNGRAKYGIDVRLVGMDYASVKHCSVFGGTMSRTPRKPSGAISVVPLTAPESRGATRAGDVNAVAVVTDSNT